MAINYRNVFSFICLNLITAVHSFFEPLFSLNRRVFIIIDALISSLFSIFFSSSYKNYVYSIDKLKSSIIEFQDNQYNFYKIIDNELFILFSILGFTDSERISLFKYDDSGQLLLIGRISTNPEFKGKGRAFYSPEEGTLGLAWTRGESIFVNNLPYDEYDYAKNWKMDEETALKLRMKSRTISAVVIRDTTNIKKAVLVFESTLPNAFNREDIEKVMEFGESKRIEMLMSSFNEILPDPTLAAKEGF